MKIQRFLAMLVAAQVLAGCAPKVAVLQPTPGGAGPLIVYGRVTNPQGAPLSGAVVTASGSDLRGLVLPSGEYRLALAATPEMQGQHYTLTYEMQGFRPAQRNVGIVPGGTVEANVVLEPR